MKKNHLFKFFTLVVILLLFSGCTGSGADDGPVIFSVSAVATGSTHTLAVATDGTLWAWGDNSNGQLGDGTKSASSVPKQIGTATDWSAVAAGSYHSIALKTDGALYAWGSNGWGQLGAGDGVPEYLVPTLIGTNHWNVITAGSAHTAAIDANGYMWSWGFNTDGSSMTGILGLGSSMPAAKYSTPQKIGSSYNWTDVAAGMSHTMALNADHKLFTWGDNGHGELGSNSTNDLNYPYLANSINNWVQIAPGNWHSVALTDTGDLYTCGNDQNGQLGNGTAGNTTAFAKIGENFSCIAAGSYHTIACASDNSIYTWGKNSDGQLGDGGVLTNSTVPILIDSGNAWTAVTSYNDHSAALKTDGTLWAWGRNDEQQIGNGGISDVLLPSRIIF